MKIILHVGTHKTATTSLQTTLKRNRDAMRRLGVLYPSGRLIGAPDMAGHHFFPALIVTGDENDLAKARMFVDRAISEHGQRDVLLISCEGFHRYVMPTGVDCAANADQWQRREAFIRRTAALCESHETEIWISLRRIDSFAISMYQERIKKTNYTYNIEKFVDQSNILLQYASNIELWSKYFDRVRVFRFEDDAQSEHGAVGAYLERLGLPVSFRESVPDPLNVSLHPHLVEFKRQLNSLGGDRQQSKRIANALMNFQSSSADSMLAERHSLLSVDERRALCARVDLQGSSVLRDSAAAWPLSGVWEVGQSSSDLWPKYPGLPDAYRKRIADHAPLLSGLAQ
ncbi:MAG: hypothetical protein DI565_19550 [Ancylobacter novellus]|uniref:Sulfotransferase domain-containing protein n=1 Tax=Ancylobacter novellus TaxID=921 RepID=A0A2W5K110_ANCNO|nr:MAG: hypothetical protein DI565_19550 [Ancylobacter novellus]